MTADLEQMITDTVICAHLCIKKWVSNVPSVIICDITKFQQRLSNYIKPFYFFLLFSLIISNRAHLSAAEALKSFQTEYTTIYYTMEEDLNLFFWRISGKDIDIHTYSGFTKSRVDRIVERIQAILDMYPQKFRVDIYIYPKYEKGPIALYSEKTKSIIAYADRVTDGVLAHEISHAVIYSYFKSPPPQKVGEILSQYVDKHLWFE